jgi:hypothetical protein
MNVGDLQTSKEPTQICQTHVKAHDGGVPTFDLYRRAFPDDATMQSLRFSRTQKSPFDPASSQAPPHPIAISYPHHHLLPDRGVGFLQDPPKPKNLAWPQHIVPIIKGDP